MTVILGINAFHGDSSACLLKGGVLLAAAVNQPALRITPLPLFQNIAVTQTP